MTRRASSSRFAYCAPLQCSHACIRSWYQHTATGPAASPTTCVASGQSRAEARADRTPVSAVIPAGADGRVTGGRLHTDVVETIGVPELLIILAVVLLVFGSKKLPELARSLGQSVKEFRKGTRDDADPQDA
jgi:sec-independent protein translocase protein TatA